jgi:hypothetical protein
METLGLDQVNAPEDISQKGGYFLVEGFGLGMVWFYQFSLGVPMIGEDLDPINGAVNPLSIDDDPGIDRNQAGLVGFVPLLEKEERAGLLHVHNERFYGEKIFRYAD